jgi:hypothetical protein
MHYGLITQQSRKAKAAKTLYESLRKKSRPAQPTVEAVADIPVSDGIQISEAEHGRILALKLQEEHLSPYFRTDMNLFHLLMLERATSMQMFRADRGILIVFEGVPSSPKPFGTSGHDLR